MRKLHILFLLIMPAFALAQNVNSYKPAFVTILSPKMGKLIMKQCSRSVPKAAKGFWRISQSEVDTLESNLRKILLMTSEDCCMNGSQLKGLDDYAFQYIGVTIKKKRYIYINAFHKADIQFNPDWKTIPVIVCDGGQGFWGALFDPDTKEFSKLAVNGTA